MIHGTSYVQELAERRKVDEAVMSSSSKTPTCVFRGTAALTDADA
jgi:hypothetical protein